MDDTGLNLGAVRLKNQPGPLLLEGHGLRRKDGHMLLCVNAHMKSFYTISPQEHMLHAPRKCEYEYDMFDDGEILSMNSSQVLDVLSDGGRIVITEI